MKKIIKSSILCLGLFFVAGKVNAQLSSETPALTGAQVENIRKASAQNKVAVNTTVALASQSTTVIVPARTSVNDKNNDVLSTAPSSKAAKLPQVPMQQDAPLKAPAAPTKE